MPPCFHEQEGIDVTALPAPNHKAKAGRGLEVSQGQFRLQLESTYEALEVAARTSPPLHPTRKTTDLAQHNNAPFANKIRWADNDDQLLNRCRAVGGFVAQGNLIVAIPHPV